MHGMLATAVRASGIQHELLPIIQRCLLMLHVLTIHATMHRLTSALF